MSSRQACFSSCLKRVIHVYNRAHGGGLGANLCLIFDFGDHTYSRACRSCLESQQPAQRRSYGDRDGKLRPKDHPVPPNRLRKVLLRIESNPAGR